MGPLRRFIKMSVLVKDLDSQLHDSKDHSLKMDVIEASENFLL